MKRRAAAALAMGLPLVLAVAAHADAQRNGGGAVDAPAGAEGAPAQPIPMYDLLLARGFRLLFQTTVENVDLDRLRANGIAKIRAKEEQSYRRQMNKIFDDLESVGVKEVLGVTRTSSRDDVIEVVERVDEAELIDAMDAIPDASIADLIERKVREQGASSFAEIQEAVETKLTEFVDGLSG